MSSSNKILIVLIWWILITIPLTIAIGNHGSNKNNGPKRERKELRIDIDRIYGENVMIVATLDGHTFTPRTTEMPIGSRLSVKLGDSIITLISKSLDVSCNDINFVFKDTTIESKIAKMLKIGDTSDCRAFIIDWDKFGHYCFDISQNVFSKHEKTHQQMSGIVIVNGLLNAICFEIIPSALYNEPSRIVQVDPSEWHQDHSGKNEPNLEDECIREKIINIFSETIFKFDPNQINDNLNDNNNADTYIKFGQNEENKENNEKEKDFIPDSLLTEKDKETLTNANLNEDIDPASAEAQLDNFDDEINEGGDFGGLEENEGIDEDKSNKKITIPCEPCEKEDEYLSNNNNNNENTNEDKFEFSKHPWSDNARIFGFGILYRRTIDHETISNGIYLIQQLVENIIPYLTSKDLILTMFPINNKYRQFGPNSAERVGITYSMNEKYSDDYNKNIKIQDRLKMPYQLILDNKTHTLSNQINTYGYFGKIIFEIPENINVQNRINLKYPDYSPPKLNEINELTLLNIFMSITDVMVIIDTAVKINNDTHQPELPIYIKDIGCEDHKQIILLGPNVPKKYKPMLKIEQPNLHVFAKQFDTNLRSETHERLSAISQIINKKVLQYAQYDTSENIEKEIKDKQKDEQEDIISGKVAYFEFTAKNIHDVTNEIENKPEYMTTTMSIDLNYNKQFTIKYNPTKSPGIEEDSKQIQSEFIIMKTDKITTMLAGSKSIFINDDPIKKEEIREHEFYVDYSKLTNEDIADTLGFYDLEYGFDILERFDSLEKHAKKIREQENAEISAIQHDAIENDPFYHDIDNINADVYGLDEQKIHVYHTLYHPFGHITFLPKNSIFVFCVKWKTRENTMSKPYVHNINLHESDKFKSDESDTNSQANKKQQSGQEEEIEEAKSNEISENSQPDKSIPINDESQTNGIDKSQTNGIDEFQSKGIDEVPVNDKKRNLLTTQSNEKAQSKEEKEEEEVEENSYSIHQQCSHNIYYNVGSELPDEFFDELNEYKDQNMYDYDDGQFNYGIKGYEDEISNILNKIDQLHSNKIENTADIKQQTKLLQSTKEQAYEQYAELKEQQALREHQKHQLIEIEAALESMNKVKESFQSRIESQKNMLQSLTNQIRSLENIKMKDDKENLNEIEKIIDKSKDDLKKYEEESRAHRDLFKTLEPILSQFENSQFIKKQTGLDKQKLSQQFEDFKKDY